MGNRLVRDDFTSDNDTQLEATTPSTPGSWEVIEGAASVWQTNIQTVQVVNATATRRQAIWQPSFTDSVGRVRVHLENTKLLGWVGVCCLVDSTQTGYFALVNSSSVAISRRVDAVDSLLVTASYSWPSVGSDTVALSVRSAGVLGLWINNSLYLSATDTAPQSVNGTSAGLYIVRSITSFAIPNWSAFVAHDLYTLVDTPTAGTQLDVDFPVALHEFEDLSEQRQQQVMMPRRRLRLSFTGVSSSRAHGIVAFVSSRGVNFEPFEVWNPIAQAPAVVRLRSPVVARRSTTPFAYDIVLDLDLEEDYA